MLIGAVPIDEATQSVELEAPPGEAAHGRTLDVLAAGSPLPPNPGELLESSAMEYHARTGQVLLRPRRHRHAAPHRCLGRIPAAHKGRRCRHRRLGRPQSTRRCGTTPSESSPVAAHHCWASSPTARSLAAPVLTLGTTSLLLLLAPQATALLLLILIQGIRSDDQELRRPLASGAGRSFGAKRGTRLTAKRRRTHLAAKRRAEAHPLGLRTDPRALVPVRRPIRATEAIEAAVTRRCRSTPCWPTLTATAVHRPKEQVT